MRIAEFEEKLAKLIAKALKDEKPEIIRAYAEHQLSIMEESRNRAEYMERMKLNSNCEAEDFQVDVEEEEILDDIPTMF